MHGGGARRTGNALAALPPKPASGQAPRQGDVISVSCFLVFANALAWFSLLK